MSAYHQMGHHTENLLFEPGLGRFAGAILSPVNYHLPEMIGQVAQIRSELPDFDVIFDPQLYVPQSLRDALPAWPYFPAAVDTADPTQLDWWRGVIDRVIEACAAFSPNAICSPVYLPTSFSYNYYDQIVRIGAEVAIQLAHEKTRGVQTFLVNLPELADTRRALEIASIASKSKIAEILLIFHTDIEPRREISDGDAMRGGMILVAALNRAGFKVIVGSCSSDMVLWRAAGAAACASGKFFNLRRFTRSRWDEPSDGGQNLPYWFEERLLAFIRDSDLVRLRAAAKLSATSLSSPYAQEVFEKLDARNTLQAGEKPGPWVGLGWRQYMHWFADAEHRLSNGLAPDELLRDAERAWLQLEDESFLMEEPRNDGTWLRQWRRALVEFRRF